MANIQRPDPLKDSHCFCLIYIMYAHVTDGWVDTTEANTILDKVHEWTNGKGTREELIKEYNESSAWYLSLIKSGDKDIFASDINRIIGAMVSTLGKDQLKAVISDLKAISKADGKVTEKEQEFIKLFEKDFGL